MKLSFIQGCRAVAALAVVLYHAHTWMIPSVLYPGAVIWRFFDAGHAGVELFFVLSGFIMMLSHGADFGRPNRFSLFLEKRFIRIYPVYWVALSALIVGHLIMGIKDDSQTAIQDIIFAFALLPTENNSILTVAWTLSHEILFYLIFGFFIINRSIGLYAIVFWALSSILHTVIFVFDVIDGSDYPLNFFFSPFALLFVGGMICARHYARLSPKGATALLLVGLIATVVIGYTDVVFDVPERQGAWPVFYGLAAMAILSAGAALEGHGRLAVPRAVTYLGDASYSIYLAHAPAMMFLSLVALKLGLAPLLSPAAMFALLCLGGVASGLIFHRVVEAPAIAALRRRSGAVASQAPGVS